jgi:hypothetical protein
MIAKIYKPILTAAVILITGTAVYAQDLSVSVSGNSSSVVCIKTKVNTKDIQAKADAFSKDLVLSLSNINIDLGDELKDIAPKIVSGINSLVSDIKVDVNTNGDGEGRSNSNSDKNSDYKSVKEKFKSYSKSYPIDGNDRIKLVNQYGKILVSTWDRHEVKVDVQIKAQAEDDEAAQKLLDGVQINDNKEGDQVTFRTEIERNNGSFSLWNFGGKKNHKVEINYTVYMPAKTDLSVEDSYGAIQLPDLSGKIKISSSYGSVEAQNLSNPANVIDGSYGSLKVASLNGAKLDYSYGSAEIDQCNNLKADLSYGSFKLGKLTGSGEFDISYVGGFKIEELASSFSKLKVDASYSSVALGVPGNNNFNFDITTTYGGFNYDDGKVTITSKTPPDGAKHIGPTRNYKGHFGKDGSEGMVDIRTSYGGVNFE